MDEFLLRFESFIGVNFWTALFVLLNTIALYLVAKKYLFGPVMQMITDRQNEIDEIYACADRDKDQAAALRAEYEEKLSAATQTSERMVKEAAARAQSREEEIVQQANKEAAAILEKAAADIAQEKKKAINEAKDEISGMAMAIAEKVVGRALSEQDQKQLVDAFIEELGGEV